MSKFCQHCGIALDEGVKFCNSCGKAAEAKPYDAVRPHVPVPTAAPLPQKKKRHIGRWVMLSVLTVIVGTVLYLVGTIFWFGPKDLGVRYTQADIDSAFAKVGIERSFNGMTGKELEEYLDKHKNEKMGVDDDDLVYSDYRQDSFALTQEEATAFLNSIAPGAFWFRNIQVRVNDDGTVEASARFDFKRADEDLFGGVADKIPFPIPGGWVNTYAKCTLVLVDNKAPSSPDSSATIQVGFLTVPDNLLTPKNIDTVNDYATNIYKFVPDLVVNALYVDENGLIVFDGYYPHSVVATSKVK
jgi:hypothetical protein